MAPTRSFAASDRTHSLSSPFIRFTLDEETGRCEITDRKAGVTWASRTPEPAPFGVVTLDVRGESRRIDLTKCEVESRKNGLLAIFRLVPNQPLTTLRVWIELLPDKRTLSFSYQQDSELAVREIALLDNLMEVTAAEKGCVVVPVREGLMIPADSGIAFTHRFDTYAYEGCHMRMLGLVKSGAAALVTWEDPYVAADVRSSLTGGAGANATAGGKAPGQTVTSVLVLKKSARSFRFTTLGSGGYVEIGKAYRQVAKDQGWLVTWDEKLKQEPKRGMLAGAVNYKLWSTLDRSMNEDSTVEQSSKLNWTFDEAAQVAEHLKNDLKLDKVLFGMGGWIHRGYDNQHPDILPSAPECGGDAAFVDCAKRVMGAGYLLALHDNYQDIYHDSPSWNENYIMKDTQGKIVRGGHWAGGSAYLTCSRMALDLAKRPQNLAAVKQLTGANAYFIDTTYASGLQECFDPNHPLTRADDMKWKQELSDYGRQVFGIFGSECGREWAIPHSDFFEGLTGVSGGPYHDANLIKKTGGVVVPLFELVYRDCIAMYGKYGYDHFKSAPYVLQHLVIGRPLNHHSIPQHLYWKRTPDKAEPPQSTPDAGIFVRADNGWAEGMHPLDRFVKNTYEILSPLNEITARMRMEAHEFLTPDRQVQKSVFGDGKRSVVVVANAGTSNYVHHSRGWGRIELPPYGFFVESPGFVAFLASRANDVSYDPPAMFTLRGLDGKSLAKSRQVRVYHAFGSPELKFNGKKLQVERETIIK